MAQQASVCGSVNIGGSVVISLVAIILNPMLTVLAGLLAILQYGPTYALEYC
ncbi:MAG: hypothetical protein H6998_00515 [Hahellaceae bacterium]|nr:hypothetical protein [Hahellaceae bacterium]